MTLDKAKNFSEFKILLIGIGFYDYETAIVKRLEELGAEVFLVIDKPKVLRVGLIRKIVGKIGIVCNFLQKHHDKRLIKLAKDKNFNKVLVIKGDGLTVTAIKGIRNVLPKSDLILYLWDSISRTPNIKEKFIYFDRVLSFDRHDAINNKKINFRPLFYRFSDETLKVNNSIDVSFIGWLHFDRLDLIKRFELEARKFGLTTYMYLYTGFFTWLKLLISGNSNLVHFRPLSYKEVLKINQASRVIVDLPHPNQSGLTMRVIEAVGSGKKIITSSRDILNYDFYRKANIELINPTSFEVNKDFILSDSKSPIPNEILSKYTLDSWLIDIFALN